LPTSRRRAFDISTCDKLTGLMDEKMTEEYEVRLEVTLNGEAAYKLLLEAKRRGVEPNLLANHLLECIAMDDMFRAVLDD
jgi:hypothetical protein